MLMLIIFVRLSKPHRRVTTLEKRLMIATAAITIATIDQPNLHRWHITFTGFFNEPRKLPRLRIVLATNAAPRHGFLLSLVRRHAFRENAHRVRIMNAVAAD